MCASRFGIEGDDATGRIRTSEKEDNMGASSYARLAAAVFALVGLLQLARAATGWEVTLNGLMIPIWASWIAAVGGLLLAWLGFAASRR